MLEKRSKAETEAFYRELLTEQKRSGLSLRAFAEARRIPAGTLSCWRHQLKQRDAAAKAVSSKTAETQFVPVSVVTPEALVKRAEPQPTERPRPETARAGYEVSLGRDRVLRLPADFDERRVAALVKAVASC